MPTAPRAPVKIASRPGNRGLRLIPSATAAIWSLRPTRWGGVAPADGLNGLVDTAIPGPFLELLISTYSIPGEDLGKII